MSLLGSVMAIPKNLIERSFSRKAFIAFAKKHDFVYFGYVDQHSDEHELVRGITLSPRHTDTNYCIGHIGGRDITLLKRTDTVSFPGKMDESYSWTIMRLDLRRSDLPHIFIDANHHDEAFYANLFVKFSSFKNANGYFVGAQFDPRFQKSYRIYTPPDASGPMRRLLVPEVTSTMLQHFRHFDFEIFEDQLLIYATEPVVTQKLLEQMLRAGLWMSETCDQYRPPETIVD